MEERNGSSRNSEKSKRMGEAEDVDFDKRQRWKGLGRTSCLEMALPNVEE